MSWFYAIQSLENVPARYAAWNLAEPWQGLYMAMIIISGFFCWSAFIFLDFRHVLTDVGNRSFGRIIVLTTAGLPAMAALLGWEAILATALMCAQAIAAQSLAAGIIAGSFVVVSFLLCLVCAVCGPMINRRTL